MLQKVQAIRNELNQNLLEREVAIEAALLALLAGEHLLLLGSPGTAKSLLVRSICERITGGVYYERLLTRFSVPEELFGPLSLAALEKDEYRRVTRGTLVEAHCVFLDEIWKANSSILNSLLTLVNERLYHEGGRALPVPLLSLFGASNETPEDDSLNALYDRFLLRVTVPYLTDDASLRTLLDMGQPPVLATITLAELQQAKHAAMAVPLEGQAKDAIIEIKHGLEAEGIAISDRRWRATAKVVRAKAWLESEPSATADSCESLVHVLWSDPSQQRLVERVVNKVCNPLNLEAVELEDAAADVMTRKPKADAQNITSALEPLLKQLDDIYARLDGRIQASPTHKTTRARQALTKVEGWHRELSQMALKSLSRLHLAPGAR
jgi:MoxR-like ATPase